MNRRSFFATLTAPLVARFIPKALPGVDHGVSIRMRDYDISRDVWVCRMDAMMFYPPIEITPNSGVDCEFSTADACFNLDELRKRYA